MKDSTFIELAISAGSVWIITLWARYYWLTRPVVVQDTDGRWRAQRGMERRRG